MNRKQCEDKCLEAARKLGLAPEQCAPRGSDRLDFADLNAPAVFRALVDMYMEGYSDSLDHTAQIFDNVVAKHGLKKA